MKENEIIKILKNPLESSIDWSTFLKNFSSCLRVDALSFLKLSKNIPKFEFFLNYNIDEKFLKNWQNKIQENHYLFDFLKKIEEEKIVDENDLFKRKDLNCEKELEYLMKMKNIKHFLILGVLNNSCENIFFVVFRFENNNNFYEKEKKFFKKIALFLKINLCFCSKLEIIENKIEILKKIIENEGKGIIVLDKNLNITLMNKSASDILSKKEGLELTKEGIEITNPVISLQFKKYLKRLYSTDLIKENLLLKIPKKRKEGNIILQIFPITDKCDFNGNLKNIIIIIYDTLALGFPDPSFLSQTFQFTPQENKIALLLSKSLDLKEIAKELEISLHTVRTHLKHIYSKTNISRQAELIKLLLSLPKQF